MYVPDSEDENRFFFMRRRENVWSCSKSVILKHVAVQYDTFFQYTALFLYYSYVPETNDAKTRKHLMTESSDKYSLCISCFIIIIM